MRSQCPRQDPRFPPESEPSVRCTPRMRRPRLLPRSPAPCPGHGSPRSADGPVGASAVPLRSVLLRTCMDRPASGSAGYTHRPLESSGISNSRAASLAFLPARLRRTSQQHPRRPPRTPCAPQRLPSLDKWMLPCQGGGWSTRTTPLSLVLQLLAAPRVLLVQARSESWAPGADRGWPPAARAPVGTLSTLFCEVRWIEGKREGLSSCRREFA